MTRMFIISAALLGLSGVGLGAFGAHGLAAVLAASERAATFDTAVQYHLIHALALLITALLVEQRPGPWAQRAGWLFILGVILFSGSLYLLAIFNLRVMGAVAPFGGAALMAGWACLGWSARR